MKKKSVDLKVRDKLPVRRKQTRLPLPPSSFSKIIGVYADGNKGGKRRSDFAVGCTDGPCLFRNSPLVYAEAGNRDGLRDAFRRVFIAHTHCCVKTGDTAACKAAHGQAKAATLTTRIKQAAYRAHCCILRSRRHTCAQKECGGKNSLTPACLN